MKSSLACCWEKRAKQGGRDSQRLSFPNELISFNRCRNPQVAFFTRRIFLHPNHLADTTNADGTSLCDGFRQSQQEFHRSAHLQRTAEFKVHAAGADITS